MAEQRRATVRETADNGGDDQQQERRKMPFADDPGGASLAIREDQQFWTARQAAGLQALGITGATPGDLMVFLHYSVKTQLDPFSRQIYFIKRRTFNRDTEQWENRWTIQIGIDGFRVIRDRAARREGCSVEYEDTVWYDADGNEHTVWLTPDPPAACKVVVVKILPDGRRLRYPGVLRYASYVATDRQGNPTGQWAVQGEHQIEKCCEAFALRRGFPHDLGGIYAEEEMQHVDYQPDARQKAQRARKTVRGKAEPEAPQPPAEDPRHAAIRELSHMFEEHGLGDATEGAIRLMFARILATPEGEELAAIDPEAGISREQAETAVLRFRELLAQWEGQMADPATQIRQMIADEQDSLADQADR